MTLEVLIHDQNGRLFAQAEADDAEGLELAARTMIREERDNNPNRQSSMGFRATATFLADGKVIFQATDRELRTQR